MERVYSALTPLYKFLFTTIFPGIWGLGSAAQFLSEDPEVREGRWEFLAVGVAGAIFIWWMFEGLKGVTLDGPVLVITNFRREIRVDAGQIARVSENRVLSPRRVKVTFQQPTEFGKSIYFIPRHSFRPFSQSEIVPRLRSLAMERGAPVS